MQIRRMVVALVAALALAGCAGTGPKQAVGTLAGGAAGGLLGSQIGAGEGNLWAIGTGAVLGAFLGSQIGASLDRADQMYAEEAYSDALENNRSGSSASWSNPDSGNYGYVTPTRTYARGGTDCRDFESTIYVDGRAQSGTGTACRNPDGSWTVMG